MINRLAVALLLLSCTMAFCQTNNQTSSPYSLFGLGSPNEASAGKTNALGKSGIALTSPAEINNLNPAAYAEIFKNSFLFDVGIKGNRNSYANSGDQDVTTTYNFSNISIALAFNEKSGIGITLSPYSDVGYFLKGVTGTIEGSDQVYYSNIEGSGGLNNAALNYGYKISPKLNVGITGSYYFGKIQEKEYVTIAYDYLDITENSYYKGLRFGAGVQYKVNNKFTVASVVTAPTTLSGTQDRTINKTVNLYTTTVNETGRSIPGFKLPLEVTVGLKYSYKEFTLNADYKKVFWDATGMTDNIGTFANQDFLGMGLEYISSRPRAPYLERIRYRLGTNMDNGYLEVKGARIKNAALTTGFGLPLSTRTNSFINLSYSYGQRGLISNTLAQENYHLFTVNLSLEDLWFVKRKYE